ncbi:MAG: hypothetical protein OES70_15515, partial [Desulfobacterales bacterium]|nr:hypothetical protein [Desulfobacterales bacterium]
CCRTSLKKDSEAKLIVAILNNLNYLSEINKNSNKTLHFSFILINIWDCTNAHGVAIILAKGD